MPNTLPVPRPDHPASPTERNELTIEAGRSFRARLTVTPSLFPAIGAMVGMILLSTAVLVRASTAHLRRR